MRVFALILCLGFAVGCRAPEGDDRWPGAIRAYEEAGDRFQPETVRLAPASLPLGEAEQEIAREIAARHEEIFRRNPPARVLAEAELVFLATGRLPELVGYYDEAIESTPEALRLLPRTAWLYQRLGLDELALERANASLERLPKDAFSHFAYAFCLGQQADRYEDPFHDVIDALRVVFELDPEFEVSGVVSNAGLRAELARLESEHSHHMPPRVPASADDGAPVVE